MGPPRAVGWRAVVPDRVVHDGPAAVFMQVHAGGAAMVGARIQRMDGERFWGFGLRSDAVERTSGVVENWVGEGPYQLAEYPLVGAITPRWALRRRLDAAYFPVPWALSSAGYGVLVESPELSRFRFTEEDAGWWSIEVLSDRLSLRLIQGDSPADVLRRFTELAGRQPYPGAAWFLGPWIQTGQADLVPLEAETSIVRALREADAPVSAVETHMRRLPAGAHEGRRDAERRRTDLFHGQGLASLTYLNPFVSEDYEARFRQASPLLQRNPRGEPYLYPAYIGGREPPLTVEGQLDFSAAGAQELFAELAREAVEDGHDGWMEDFGEYTPPDAVCADGVKGEAAHNAYPVRFHAAGEQAAKGHGRPIARFARSGWTGAARHLPLVWGGDPTTGWGFDGLASALAQGLNAGLSGIAFFGSDIGGFFTLGEEELDAELLVRWIQLGALSPLMRTKAEGVSIPQRPRPQVWDAEILPHWRRWARLHTQLSPYLLGAAAEYAETGMPLMRHLCLSEAGEWPSDQYTLGPSLLVAPVLGPRVVERSVQLPPGPWIDLWRSLAYDEATGGLAARRAHLLDGPARATIPAPLEEIPVLLRAGAVIPLLAPDVRSLAVPGHEASVRLLAFPAGDSSQRAWRGGTITSAKTAREWRLEITIENDTGIGLQAWLDFEPRRLEVEGGRLSGWSYDAETRVLRADMGGSELILKAFS